ncbi:hypothetical protein [Xanthomonas sacchari]|uniref:Uncharacterized protein n=1 Tax=Xanthomonas sacchari TaxID=56458 RepID=A0A2P5Z9K2_9XANT|nr:hypothetical protein [Xanthomonas sacchari]MDV0439434.1 hypothetical protein [Xanthomonas sacchari]PPU85310.1 hypothetical protein XsacCFBP4641_01590 [Xanthomonas sacchari]
MSDGSRGVEPSLPELLSQIWARVVVQVNKLIAAHERFGFVKFSEVLNPSLPDVLQGFEFIDFALIQLVDSGLLEYDETRNALNSRQCILKMRQLAAALESNEHAEAERIMVELRQQSQF